MKNTIKIISAAETYPVRHPVLRAGQSLASCRMEADDLEDTFHFGIYRDEKLAGVATFMKDKNARFDGEQYRLRGMAVLPEHRTLGLGRELLKHSEQFLTARNVGTLWFNARVGAVPFYKRMGYTAVGLPFEIETIGTHYLMFKKI